MRFCAYKTSIDPSTVNLVEVHLDDELYYYYYYFICPPTIAGDSTNILLNFTIHDANAIDIYIYTLRSLLAVLYQSNVSSNVIMCLTTSCVSYATLYARIQSSIQTFVRSTLLLFLEKPQSFVLVEILILPKRNSTWYLSEYQCLKTDFVLQCIDTPTPNHWC